MLLHLRFIHLRIWFALIYITVNNSRLSTLKKKRKKNITHFYVNLKQNHVVIHHHLFDPLRWNIGRSPIVDDPEQTC